MHRTAAGMPQKIPESGVPQRQVRRQRLTHSVGRKREIADRCVSGAPEAGLGYDSTYPGKFNLSAAC